MYRNIQKITAFSQAKNSQGTTEMGSDDIPFVISGQYTFPDRKCTVRSHHAQYYPSFF